MLSKNNKWFLLFLLSLIWGSSFILIKRGLVGLNPYQLGALRLIFAFSFLIVVGFKSLFKIPSYKWKYVILTAIFGNGLPVFLFAYAQTGMKSSVSGVLNSLTPLYTLLIGAIAFGLTFLRNQVIGILLGLIGCLFLVYFGKESNEETHYFHALLVVIATVCYALNVNLIKKYLPDVSPLSISTGNFSVMLIPALIILFYNGYGEIILETKTIHSTLFILILGMVGTGIANILYYQLIQISSPLFASSVTYFIPIIALSWGILDNETLNPMQLVSTGIILSGVYLASKK
ncbi:DMT family transporter [Flavobacterium oreochromis]|uniref:Permease n=2 Tax=Flavobacterium TaxID=237 RepID=A0A246GBK9_9FLAO|nr:DMT family transporter [Flavobacterium oreochromis]OWP77224.1 permease [Flavobacterium oreochromis]OWP78104.1 permease [Flavobacterium oreochromis]POR28778.1 permease [Flavobacterium columnare]QYS87431.1 DMT family transporter [Flavobacterium oreochromis]